ncbi:VWA domain-containing protein [Desulfitobacterium sp. THU1]|uniref:vWA domain-containing protein n=1 Tax=Desulfitobacterium sp. THU1 TaxID=3138072 RepID=UPI00311E0BC2
MFVFIKKMISCLLVLMLAMGGLSGCGNQTTAVDTLSDNERYKDLQPPKTGPVGEWDIPIPAINPLGSQSLYSATDYTTGGHEMTYIDNFLENTCSVEGEKWTLQVNDPSGAPLYFLKKYAVENNMKVFTSLYGDRLTFQLAKDEDSLWWADAVAEDNGYILNVVRELRVPVGKEKRFTLADLDPETEKVSFSTVSTGKNFQSVALKLPDGNLDLTISGTNASGFVTRSIYDSYNFSALKTKEYVIDSLPQGESSITWTFSWEAESKPTEFTFLLSELQELPTVKLGGELGALKVCGVPFGSVVVEPQKGSQILHTDIPSLAEGPLRGDITPEGDTLFWLPSGLWNVVLEADSAGLQHSKARMIPVNAGETTVLTFPTSLQSAYFQLNQTFAEPEELTGGIEVIETKDAGKQATVSLLVRDPQKRDIFPTKDNTQILEGGQPVEITDITRQITPPSIVLVLDSSGSMQKEMAATVEAAKKFINSLPDKTYIKVLDFDSSVKVLPGETKEAVLKSLSTIVAEGSTVLFDATLEGMRLLKDKERPTLVVFADGADSSLDGQGVGSSSDKQAVLEEIQNMKVPIFTIGFGAKPDATAMKEFSAASGGRYYSAKDEEALIEVFTAISGTFGNSFAMTYKRPKEASPSETPIVSLVLDASGSMDTDPTEEGCDYRLDKTKVLFHDFIQKLPGHYLTQQISFQTAAMGDPIIRQGQVTTQDKNKLLQGLGELSAAGGTPIAQAITIAYENIRTVPSTKKAIVFLTDAGLDVEEEEQAEFEKILALIKKDNIAVLWAGIGVEEYKDVFAKTAALSGGSYIISDEAAGLESALGEMLASIENMEGTQNIPLSIQINDKAASGTLLSYAANTYVNFAPPPKSDQIIAPDVVQLATGTPLKRYDNQAANLVTGTGVPGIDTILTKRIPFNASAGNKAMDLTVQEAYYFSKFKGLEPPSDKQFLALELTLKNTTADKIPYLIPSIYSHFYININNEGSYPVSEVTWLTETPLANPGNPAITIPAKEELVGTLVFLVPNDPVTQTSLHFYDVDQDHIHLPLIGKPNKTLQQLTSLPKEEPAKITDAFAMAVTAADVVDKIDIYPAEPAKDQPVFRVVEGAFSTKVQALLDINPKDRLWLKIDTANGPLLTQMSDVTTVMPMGFSAPVMLAPASTNRVRFAYPFARALSSSKADIWGDLRGGNLEIPVVKGNPYGKAVNKPAFSGDGLQMKVNYLTTLKGIESFGDRWVIADVTFTDTKDGFGTAIPSDFLKLIHKDFVETTNMQKQGYKATGSNLGDLSNGVESEGIRESSASEDYLYGIDGEWAVFDGGERRGFMFFQLPESGQVSDWSLQSSYLKELNVPVTQEPYVDAGLLIYKEQYQVLDNEFEARLDEAVEKAILNYQSRKASEGKPDKIQRVTFSQEEGKNSIPKPAITVGGAQKLHNITSLEDFSKTLDVLRWLPSQDTPGFYRYAPEAVLTQGWGTEWDLANMAMGLLSKAGCTPQYRTIALTDEGKAALLKLPEAQTEKQAKAYEETGKKGITGFFSRLFAKIAALFSSPKEVEKLPETQVAVDKIRENGSETPPDSEVAAEEVTGETTEQEYTEEETAEEEQAADNEELTEEEPIEDESTMPEENLKEAEHADEETSTEKMNIPTGTIPGIAYQTPQGESKLLVIPFMKDISELQGLVYIPHLQIPVDFAPVQGTIRISAKAESSGMLFQEAAGDIVSALGGGGEATSEYESITLLEKEISLPTLSLDAVDIGYLQAGSAQGKRFTAALITPEGVEAGTGIIDTGANPPVGVTIEIILPEKSLIHESPITKGEGLDTIYHTLAVNLPDLAGDSTEMLETASAKIHESADNPDSFSTLKWYSRNIIERFIANQTTFDAEQQTENGLLLGRTAKERCIVLTSRMGKDAKIYSTLDLLQTNNQVHNGSQAVQAGYNIVAGLYASSLESAVLTGENKAGYQDIWSGTPADTSLMLIPNEDGRDLVLAEMRKSEKYPERLLANIANSDKVIIAPDQPGEYMGQKRWAWLEIDPVTYETISVIDTGEHAGMASYAMALMPGEDDTGQYMVGALIGVDVALWSVCSFSLILDDYQEILTEAKAMAMGIGENLDMVMKGYGGGRNAGEGKVSGDLSAKGLPLKISGELEFGDKVKGKVGIGQNLIGFTDGFNDAVKLYFATAKPKEPGKGP